MSVQVQEISKESLVKISGNNKIIGRLMWVFDVHYKTIERWIDANDLRLTTHPALQIISEELGVSIDEILNDKDN